MSNSNNGNTKGIYACPILFVDNLIGDIYLMRLQCPPIAQFVQPGQFVNIKVNNEFIPLLRKPFSVCRCGKEEGWLEVLWKIVGKGTEIMANMKAGEQLNVLGPLGRGFWVPPGLQNAALVGGGLGIAPLPFLCADLLKRGTAVEVFLGAKSAHELAFITAFQEMGVKVNISTEDGSQGEPGLVSEIVTARLSQEQMVKLQYLFSCGPTGLLKRMIKITERFDIAGQISIETMMACGFGICMGCPIRVRDVKASAKHYKLTCLDGPVFNAREIILDD